MVDRLLTADEVAEWLGVSEYGVYSMARAGTIPSVKIGRKVRFRRDRLQEWLDSRERGVADES